MSRRENAREGEEGSSRAAANSFSRKKKRKNKKGFTEWARAQAGKLFHGDPKAKLTKQQEVGAGIVGGVLACWNHPIGEYKNERMREREEEERERERERRKAATTTTTMPGD